MEDDSCGTEGASRWTAIMRSDTVYGNNGFEYLQPTSFPPAAQQIPQPHQQVARSQHDGPHYVARSPIDAQNRDSDNRTRPSHAATSFIATTQHIAAPNISHSESTVDGRYRMLGTAMRWNVVNVDEPCTGDQNFVTLDHVSQGQRLIHIGTGNLVDPASSPHIAFGPSFGVAGTIPSSNESWWSEQTPETPNNDSIYPPSIEELEDVPTAPRQPLHSPWTYVAATGAMMQSQAYEPSTLPNRISAAGSSRTTYQPTTSSVLQSRPRMSSDSSWDRRPNKTSHSMSTLQPPTTSYGQLQSGHGTASYSMEAAHQSQYLRKSFEDGRTRRPSSGGLSVPDDAASPGSSILSVTPGNVSDPLPCRCDGCTISFSGKYRRGNLARHIRIVHTGRAYICGIDGCRKKYRRQDARLKHQRSKHGDVVL